MGSWFDSPRLEVEGVILEDLEELAAFKEYLRKLTRSSGLRSDQAIVDESDSEIDRKTINDFFNPTKTVKLGSSAFTAIIAALNSKNGHKSPLISRDRLIKQFRAQVCPTVAPLGFRLLDDLPDTGLGAFLNEESLAWYPLSKFLHELPPPPDAPFGYDEQKLLQSILENPKHHIITGQGGIGKTRLALELGKRARSKAWLVFRITPDARENDLEKLIASRTGAKLLLIIDYVETLQSALPFDRLIQMVKIANAEGETVRVLATCRKTYFDNLTLIPGLRSELREGIQFAMSPSPDTKDSNWMRQWRLSIVAHILGCEINELDTDTYDIPVIALIVRELAGDDHGLRTRQDIRVWLFQRLTASIRDTDGALDLSAQHRVLPDLASFLMMFPFTAESKQCFTPFQHSVYIALTKDGFASQTEGQIELAHDLVCDLILELWLSDEDTTYSDILGRLAAEKERFGSTLGSPQAVTRTLIDANTREKLLSMRVMIDSAEYVARSRTELQDEALEMLNACFLNVDLGVEEKTRVFQATPTLSNDQVSALQEVFSEEKAKLIEAFADSAVIWEFLKPSTFWATFAGDRRLWAESLHSLSDDPISKAILKELECLQYLGNEAAVHNVNVFTEFMIHCDDTLTLPSLHLATIAALMADLRGDDELAEALYARAIVADPNNARILGNFAYLMTDLRRDHDRAEDLYALAIEADPNDARILGNFANFMTDFRRDHDRAEDLYALAIEADPNNAHILGNFANFMTDLRRDHDRAEDLYALAIEADPNNAHILGNFANFMTDLRRDHDRAEDLYALAIEADPNNAHILGNFAIFMWQVRGDRDQAEDLYARAIAADPNHAKALANFGIFMASVRGDYDHAEALFARAIAADPNHANALGNFAYLMASVRGDHDQAEDLYARAVAAAPNHGNTLGNFATFMWKVRGDHKHAEDLFARAVAADPNHGNTLGNFATFMWKVRGDHKQAEDLFARAIAADPNHGHILGTFAFFMESVRGDHEQAEALYIRAIAADPNHANTLGTFATFMCQIRGDHKQAEYLYARAIAADPNDANTLGNFAKFLFARGRSEEGIQHLANAELLPTYAPELTCELAFYRYAHVKDTGLKRLKELLIEGVRTPGWPLGENTERAIKDGHSAPELLNDIAAVMSKGADIRLLDRHQAWRSA